MTDRDRVLMNIALRTSRQSFDITRRTCSGWGIVVSYGRPAPQFVSEECAKSIGLPLTSGDVVKCNTSAYFRTHAWGIAEFVEKLDFSSFLLREIGGDRLCKVSNESVDVLRFMPQRLLYTGKKHQLYEWLSRKAFSNRWNSSADYCKRFGGATIGGDSSGGLMTWWSRPYLLSAMDIQPGLCTVLHKQKRRFSMNWNKRTKLKDIVQVMNEQGFREEFEYRPEKQVGADEYQSVMDQLLP